MKKIIIIIVGLVITVVAVGLVIAGNYFYSESVKRGVSVELHSEPEAVTALADQYNDLIEQAKQWYSEQPKTTLEIESYDGLKLSATYIKNPMSQGKAVILSHGYRGQSEDMNEYPQFYYELGFDILMPDARGHGESEGDYIGYGWHDRKDLVSWIDLLIEEENKRDILLHGNSMGAALVLMTSGESLPKEVKGIIADSSYTSVADELSYQMKHLYNLPSFPMIPITSVITKIRAGYTFEEASALEQVKKNKKPLWIIHGEADELVPTEMAKSLYAAANGEKELWIVPQAGHTKAYSLVTKEFQFRLTKFVNKVIESN